MKTYRSRLVNWYIYFRFLYGRGGSHIGLALDLASKVFSFAVLIKLYGLPDSLTVYAGVLLIIITVGLGWIDVKKHIANKETSFNNQFNPELQELLRRKR